MTLLDNPGILNSVTDSLPYADLPDADGTYRVPVSYDATEGMRYRRTGSLFCDKNLIVTPLVEYPDMEQTGILWMEFRLRAILAMRAKKKKRPVLNITTEVIECLQSPNDAGWVAPIVHTCVRCKSAFASATNPERVQPPSGRLGCWIAMNALGYHSHSEIGMAGRICCLQQSI